MQVDCSSSSSFSWPNFEMENSAVTEWHLVCTEQYKVWLIRSCFMIKPIFSDLDDQAHFLQSLGWSRSNHTWSRSDLDHFYSSPKVGLSSSLYFIGLMIGSVVTGGLADVWGRRPTLLVSCDGDIRWSSMIIIADVWGRRSTLLVSCEELMMNTELMLLIWLAWLWIHMFELLLRWWKPWPNLSPLGYDHLDFSILCCGCILSRILVLLNI